MNCKIESRPVLDSNSKNQIPMSKECPEPNFKIRNRAFAGHSVTRLENLEFEIWTFLGHWVLDHRIYAIVCSRTICQSTSTPSPGRSEIVTSGPSIAIGFLAMRTSW